MDSSPNLTLPYIIAAQAQKHVTHNEAVRGLDAIVQLMVLDKDLASPPGSPSDGSRYIVAASPTGAWSGQAGKVAAWQDGAWAFYAPRAGWLAWVADESKIYVHDGSAWGEVTVGVGGGASVWGINATADTTNRLAVKSTASLFDNVGNGHQHKINKNAAADTASLLFQTGYSGRAEMGTAGDDDFHVKVSADGSAWLEALVIDRSSGEARLPQSARFLSGFDQPINLSLAASVAANALTVAVKGADGNDPSSANPVFVPFRSATPTDGKPYWRKITGALSLTIDSGVKIGTENSVPFRLWLALFDDAGTLRLGAFNARVGGASPTRIAGLNETAVASSTAQAGSGSGAGGTFYTGTAVSSKAFRILGFMSWETALATAGSWSAGPDVIQLFGPGTPKPGDVVDTVHAINSTQFSTTSSSFQTTNLSAAITPKSKANLVEFLAGGGFDVSANNRTLFGQVHRDATAVGKLVVGATTAGGETFFDGTLCGLDAPGSTSSLAYAVKIKNSDNATTVYFAVLNSATVMLLKEIMG